MKLLQEKLDFLLEKYSVDTKATLKDRQTVIIGGEALPLLAHRSERRFIELKNMVTGGTLTGISVMRTMRILEKGADLYEALYRELDLCQFMLQRTIKSITVMANGNVMNVIATTADGVVCTLELAATLAAGEPPKDKHEIIAEHGIACDIVVDAQLKQDSIYVFGANGNAAYTDVDFELYGLSIEDIAVVREAFAIARDKTSEEMKAIDANLRALVALAKKSANSGEREVL
jgi:hypothetical protein